MESVSWVIKLTPKTKTYKVVQIWPGLIVCKQVTVCPGHIWTTLYHSEHGESFKTELKRITFRP
jgi:hypothetical protein